MHFNKVSFYHNIIKAQALCSPTVQWKNIWKNKIFLKKSELFFSIVNVLNFINHINKYSLKIYINCILLECTKMCAMKIKSAFLSIMLLCASFIEDLTCTKGHTVINCWVAKNSCHTNRHLVYTYMYICCMYIDRLMANLANFTSHSSVMWQLFSLGHV